jgi:branched-chain amino acid transport system ATP-binding protein
MGAFRFRTVDRKDLNRVLELFPRLGERMKQQAGTLSGGEQQMLAIGRALMGKPRLLLLDEPSLGLAPQVVAQILRRLSDLRERTGLTVLIVEQNARAALSIADRGIVLSLGRVVADEDPAALAADDQLRHAYLGF